MMRFCFRLWSITLICAATVAGAVSQNASAEAKESASQSRVFNLRLASEPETLDWNKAHTTIETYILMNLMEGLVAFDERFKLVPALAEKMVISDGGKVYTFHIKKDVKWSDGVALTANDFVYSWKRLLSPVTAASYAYFLYDIDGAEEFNKGMITDFNLVGIKALGDHVFQVRLKKPVAHWIYIPTFWVTFPLRKDIVDKHGAAWAKPGRMVTAGPYTLASHDLSTKLVLKANPRYHGKMGNIQEVHAWIVEDDSTALNLYETGKLDFITNISTLDLKRLSNRSDLKTFPYLKTYYLAFNVANYPVNNDKIRRAVSMAIDKTKVASILYGGQTPATSFVPPQVMAYQKELGPAYDPVAARKELKAAGWDTTRTLKLELLTENWAKPLTIAQFIQGELKKNLGIDIVIQPFDHKTFRAQLDLGSYPVSLLHWGADYPDPDNFLSVFLSDVGNNKTRWKNAKFDEWVLGARNENDKNKRKVAYSQAQKLFIEQEAVIVPLFYEPNTALIKPRAKGVVLNPLNYLYLKGVTLGN